MTELVGGNNDDSFVASVNHGSRVTLRGGEGTNTLDLSGLGTDTVVQVESVEAADEDPSNWLISDITEVTGVEGDFSTTLRVPSGDNLWTINDVNIGEVKQVEPGTGEEDNRLFDETISFSKVDTLVGGSGDDTFTFQRGSDGNGSLTGGVDGGAGDSNQIVAGNVNNIWSYHEPDGAGERTATLREGADPTSATSYLPEFANIQKLKGGTGDDQFILSGAVSLAEIHGGEGGSNSLTVEDGDNTWTLDGEFSGNVDGGKVTSFLEIQSLTGSGSGNDTLKGRDQNNAWVLSGPKAGSVGWWNPDDENATATDTLKFDEMSTLEGRSYSDRFTLEQDAVFEGTLVGTTAGEQNIEGSQDSLVVENGSNAWVLEGLDAGSVADKADSDITRIGSFSGIQKLTGNGDDSLTAPVGAANYSWNGVSEGQWTVTNTGTEKTLAFSGMSSLTGSDGDDTFTPGSNTTALRVDGGEAGTDTLNLAKMADQTVVVGERADGTEVTGWKAANLTNLTGSTGTTTLEVTSGHNSWSVNSAFAGEVKPADSEDPSPLSSTLSFTGVTTLIGGSGDDSFTVQTGATITGIEGGTGSDKLTVQSDEGDTVDWSLNENNGGGPVTRDPQGDDPAYSVVTTFSGIENLTGGEGNDQFSVDGDVAFDGLVDGAGGDTNTLDLSKWDNGKDSLSIGFGTDNEIWNIAGINSLTGSGTDASLSMAYGTNTWTITDENAGNIEHSIVDDPENPDTLFSDTLTFSGFGNLNGGTGNDTFILEAVDPDVVDDVAGSITGRINGGVDPDNDSGPSNTLTVKGGTNTWKLDHSDSNVVAVADGNATRVSEFSHIQVVNGEGSDSFYGKNEATYWSSDTNGTWDLSTSTLAADQYLTVTGMGALFGGSGADTFTLDENVSYLGSIDGGSDLNNTLSVVGGDNTWNLDHSGDDVFAIVKDGAARLTAFDHIQTLNGADSDTLHGRNETTYWSSETNGTWDLSTSALAADQYLTVTGMGALFGGSEADTFTLETGVSYLGSIDGGSDLNNTLTVVGGDNTWNLDHSGDDVFAVVKNGATRLTSFDHIQTLNGADSDTLHGRDETTYWNSEAEGTWSLSTSDSNDGRYLTLTGMSQLFGGSGADTFTLGDGVAHLGSIDGGSDLNNTLTVAGGDNTWNLDHSDAGVNAIVKDGAARLTSFDNIQTLNGADSDALHGRNETTYWSSDTNGTWNLSTSDSDDDRYLTLTGMSQLFGGTGADTFTLGDGVAHLGSIDGGSGLDNTLTVVGGDNTWNLDHSDGSVNAIVKDGAARLTAFNNIQMANGAGSDLVYGRNETTYWNSEAEGTWSLSTSDSNDGRYLTLTGMSQLFGGSGADTFTLGDGVAHLGSIDGGSDLNNTLTVAGGDNTWNLDHSDAGVNAIVKDGAARLTSFDNIQVANGAGSDLVYGSNETTYWNSETDGTWNLSTSDSNDDRYLALTGMSQLFGGSGADTFTLDENASYLGSIDGGSDLNNTLSVVGGDNTWNLDHSDAGVNAIVKGGAARLTSFDNIQVANGAGSDLVYGRNEATYWNSETDGTWNLSTSDSNDDRYLTMTGMRQLFGGTGADTFTLGEGVSHLGSIDGGSGLDNTLTVVGGNNTWNLDHSDDGVHAIVKDGAARLTAFNNIQMANGAGSDSFYGKNETTYWSTDTNGTWNLSTSDSNDDRYLTMTGMSQLFGGTESDTFTLGEGVSHLGSIDGGSSAPNTLRVLEGSNSWQLNEAGDDTALVVGSVTGRVDDFSSFQTLQGSGTDTFYGRNRTTGWTLSENAADHNDEWSLDEGTGSIEGLTLKGMNKLVGGNDVDTFTLNASTDFNGTVDGGASGGDTLEVKGGGNAWRISGYGTNNTDGVAGEVTSLSTEFSAINILTGAAGDRLSAPNESNNWSLTGADSGTVVAADGIGSDVEFSGMSALVGGSGTDKFVTSGKTLFAGVVDGGAGGDDSLDLLSMGSTAVTVGMLAPDNNASSWEARGDDDVTIRNLETLRAGEAANNVDNDTGNTLLGPVADRYIWTLTGENIGTVEPSPGGAEDTTLAFFGFAYLQGGEHSDLRFDGGNVTGGITGGTGETWLDYSLVEEDLCVNLLSGSDACDSPVLRGIDGVIGNGRENSEFNSQLLANGAGDYDWVIDDNGHDRADGINDGEFQHGDETVAFIDFNQLLGGAGEDRFLFQNQGRLSGYIDGRDGSNTVNSVQSNRDLAFRLKETAPEGSNGAGVWLKGVGTITAHGSRNNQLIGETDGSQWVVDGENRGHLNNNAISFSGIGQLWGGSGSDTFTIEQAGRLSGGITGGNGEGRDSLRVESGNNDTIAWSVTGAGTGTVDRGGSFSELEVLNGGRGVDQFTLNGAEAWVDDINGSSGENTLSYSADDTDPVVATWTLSGARNGSVTLGDNGEAIGFTAIGDITGAGSDWLSASNAQNNWSLSSAHGGTLETVTGNDSQSLTFDGMATLEGSQGVDHFTLNGANFAGTLLGGSGDDVVSAQGANTWRLSANGNGTLNNATKFESIKTLNGGGENNELIAPARVNEWTLTGAGSGTVKEGGTTDLAMTFTGMAILTGNDQKDSFAANDAFTREHLQSFAALNGGGGAADELDLSTLDEAITLSLGQPEDGQEVEHDVHIDSFVSGFETLSGAAGAANHLLGAGDRAYRWNITGENQGEVEYFEGATDQTTVAFTDFSRLTGGAASDTFAMFDGGKTSGKIDGGRGINLIDYSRKDEEVKVTFAGFGSNIVNITGVIGNNAGSGEHLSRLLLGETEANANWRLGSIAAIDQSCTENCQNDGLNDGVVTLGEESLYFINFNVLEGGSGQDTFTLAEDGRFIGTLKGGIGADTLNISGAGSAQSVGFGESTPADTHLVGVETLSGSNAVHHRLYGADTDNTWRLDANGGGSLNGEDLSFTGIQQLFGGTGEDTFILTGEGKAHTLHGGVEGENNSLDISASQSALLVSLDLDSTEADIIRVAGLDDLTGGSEQAHQLHADNVSNTWAIDGRNRGTLNDSLEFSGVHALLGNDGTDAFIFSGAGRLDGYVDGGNNTGNRVDLSQLADGESWTLATSLDLAADLNMLNIQKLDAERDAAHTLLGTNGDTEWTITGINSGTRGGLTFSGVATLLGGTGKDDFEFGSAGELSGYVDGGAGTGRNTVDLSAKNTVDVTVGTDQGDLRRFHHLTGNNRQTTLTALEDGNTWRLESGENAGQLNNRLSFSGVTDLVAGDGGDTFHLNGGLVTGGITGGAGDDRFNLTLAADAEGELSLNGVKGRDELWVSGGGSGTQAEYYARRRAPERLTYTGANNRVFEVAFEGLERVQDDVTASQLRINTSLEADTLSMEDNAIQVNGLTQLDYNNKTHLVLAANSDDIVELNGAVSIPGRLEIRNAKVRQATQDRLKARELHLVGVGAFGTPEAAIHTGIDALYADVGQGGLALNNDGALNLAQLNSLGETAIYSAGNITSTADLSAAGDIHLRSDLGGIRLEGDNRFSGATHLQAAHDILLRHDRDLTLGDVSGKTLTLKNRGDVNGQGAWDLSTAVVSLDGSLTALNSGNRLGTLRVERADNVELKSRGALAVGAVDSRGAVDLSANGLSLDGPLTAENLTLNAGRDALRVDAAVDIEQRLEAKASGITVNRALTADALMLDAGEDALEVNATLKALGAEGVTLASGAFAQNARIDSAGIIDIDASGDLQQRAELSARAGIEVVADGELTMSREARSSTDNGTIRYQAGDNLWVSHLDNADGTIALVSGRRIESALSEGIGLRSQRIEFESVEGIGTQTPLAMETQELHALNQSGPVSLTNQGELRIERLATNGNITLENKGTVTLDNRDAPVFDRASSDAVEGGGIANANYNQGSLSITTEKGSLLALGPIDYGKPDLVGRSGIFLVDGDIGSSARPLVMYFRDLVYLQGIRSWKPYWAFYKSPEKFENNSDVVVNQDLTSAGEQLVEVEGLEDVDPAIFTEVRNYTYDEVSILMPPDQRYEDDDDDERYSADY
ncbi:beta strand repeat-containing protein [Marinimicrobium locisalis]|uniref:beta strand repeat-containing protein n=1 Tax=Marinimicrobium locisalis TaxID=546022 RepID=UPI003221DE04